jgi:hypothetical protein
MKSNWTLRGLNYCLLGFVAVCLFAGSALGKEKAYQGNFTLPFEAKWGLATLPAGNYSFTVDSTSVTGSVRVMGQDGKKTQAFIRIWGVSDQQDIEQPSQLIVIPTSRGAYRILAFQEPRLGMLLTFAVPKAERQLIAQAAPEEFPILLVSASAR